MIKKATTLLPQRKHRSPEIEALLHVKVAATPAIELTDPDNDVDKMRAAMKKAEDIVEDDMAKQEPDPMAPEEDPPLSSEGEYGRDQASGLRKILKAQEKYSPQPEELSDAEVQATSDVVTKRTEFGGAPSDDPTGLNRPSESGTEAYDNIHPDIHSAEPSVGKLARWKDSLPGGLADEKEPSDFSAEALAKGLNVELEHTDDEQTAREIAMDHLTEDPEYYDKLEVMEKEANGDMVEWLGKLNKKDHEAYIEARKVIDSIHRKQRKKEASHITPMPEGWREYLKLAGKGELITPKNPTPLKGNSKSTVTGRREETPMIPRDKERSFKSKAKHNYDKLDPHEGHMNSTSRHPSDGETMHSGKGKTAHKGIRDVIKDAKRNNLNGHWSATSFKDRLGVKPVSPSKVGVGRVTKGKDAGKYVGYSHRAYNVFATQSAAENFAEKVSSKDPRLEELSEVEHDQWMKWTKDVAKKEDISPGRLKRWKKYWVPYDELPESAKEQDREFARKAEKVIKKHEKDASIWLPDFDDVQEPAPFERYLATQELEKAAGIRVPQNGMEKEAYYVRFDYKDGSFLYGDVVRKVGQHVLQMRDVKIRTPLGTEVFPHYTLMLSPDRVAGAVGLVKKESLS